MKARWTPRSYSLTAEEVLTMPSEKAEGSAMSRQTFLKTAGAAALAGSVLGLGGITVKARSASALTPSAGQTVVAPSLKASTFDVGTGILINKDNVTVVNPRIEDFNRGIEVVPKADSTPPKNIRIIFDMNATGAAEAGMFHNRYGVRLRRFIGLELGSVTPGAYLLFRDNYRPLTLLGGLSGDIHHCDILGPNYVFPNAKDGEAGAIIGIKGLHSTTDGPPYETSDINVHHNKVGQVFEEGISFDPGNDTGMPIREMDKVFSVSAANDYIDLASTLWKGKGNVYGGYYVVFASGSAGGEVLKIRFQSAKRLNVTDPNNVLSRVKVGDLAVILMPYLRIKIDDNEVDATGSKTGIVFPAVHYGSIARNRVVGYSNHDYLDKFQLRQDASGVTVPQAIRVASMAGHPSTGSIVPGTKRVPTSFNTVALNVCDADLSLHLILWENDPYDVPNYWVGNTFTGSEQLWVKNHTLLASPPSG